MYIFLIYTLIYFEFLGLSSFHNFEKIIILFTCRRQHLPFCRISYAFFFFAFRLPLPIHWRGIVLENVPGHAPPISGRHSQQPQSHDLVVAE
jgi:hypothetical protein